ncbi:pyridoxamine 5'-phosphate oxidase family protein [Labedaea rhizosphaerae]|uniref:Nitroimidazol reductase NimA-like FMN-containing flavoprotein (Pyridoxamine 5'-phosphate oxidase superfamily) n=1 Tax=Labedaea rhizosphaerae TaxID=598644 RepID=A0A4R6SDF7_LABRH|nr:pyridoxamine 5'-phosphate oxidase family protein [Labedaea rhizosphaerae]TDP98159.1 nitroimidazol reductase NimA-like FMN-containing flavoprotein (pyridoxamine 5'-phosphate oxidase superfamily) [Labedaea rhizosphaerae]
MTETRAEQASRVIGASTYMVLATADETGTPWATPVYYRSRDDREFFWVSSPEARHSANIAVRPQVAITIFDSSVVPGTAEAVYLAATAAEVPPDALEDGASVFNSGIARSIPVEDMTGEAPFRLYRAVATEHYVLLRGGDPDNARGADDRLRVDVGPRDQPGGMR